MNPNENDKWQLNKKPPIALVDELASELCQEYNNHAFFKWYCLVINILGINRIKEIQSRCSDSKIKGQLFSRIASEAAKEKIGIDRYQNLRSRYGR